MLKKEVVKILGSLGVKTTEDKLEIPPQEEFGDIAFPCFELAKIQKRSPQSIAEDLVKKIKPSGVISKVEAKGGYVNFFFNYQKLTGIILKEILRKKEKYGKSVSGKTAVVDYSSPNPAHPIHVGSARSTFIGESLSRILERVGCNVKRICYINDLGKQTAKLLWGYLKFAKGKKPNKKPDKWLLNIYVKANKTLAENPELEKEIEELLRKCEGGDKKLLAVLKGLVNWCIDGFKQTYETIGIEFDEYMWESKFIRESKRYVKKLLKKGDAFKTADGAIVVNLEKHGLPSTVLLRYDGTGLYLTRDVATTIHKFKKYKPALNVYVSAEDQKLHFQQEFKILELLGFKKFAKNSFHLSYGYVNLPEGKLSSRLGRVVLIDDVFEEAVKRAKKLSKSEKIAKAVGISAVIYAILRIDPDKQVTFDWDEILSLEGNTAPYLQYAYTRCSGILRKSEKFKPVHTAKELTDYEKTLVKLLSRFPQVIEDSVKDLRPSYVCNYAYELATRFNEFYENCPVIKARKKLKNFRLTLVKATQIILENCLKLIGIETVEKM